MPTATNDGVALHYEVAGEPADDAAPVAFVEDACFGAWTWAWCWEGVAGPRRAVLWDLRGTGRSDAPAGPYDVATLVADLERVLDAAGASGPHLVGCGLGGMVAAEYAREHRARSLTLLGTAARQSYPPALREQLLDGDPRRSLAPAVSEAFLDSEVGERAVAWRADDDPAPAARDAQLAAAEAHEVDALHEVTAPARVLHGTDDRLWDPEGGRALADALPRGEFEAVEDAAHLLPAEAGPAVADDLAGFLERVADGGSER